MDKKKAAAWFLIFLMVFSLVGFLGGSFFAPAVVANTQDYNGFTFSQQPGYWLLQKDGIDYGFQYLPTELENINLPISPTSWLGQEKVYVGFNPNDTLNVTSTLNLLSAVLYNNNLRGQQACTTAENCPDVPVLDCATTPAVVIQLSTEKSISKDNECLVVNTDGGIELQRNTERIIYELLGIMK